MNSFSLKKTTKKNIVFNAKLLCTFILITQSHLVRHLLPSCQDAVWGICMKRKQSVDMNYSVAKQPSRFSCKTFHKSRVCSNNELDCTTAVNWSNQRQILVKRHRFLEFEQQNKRQPWKQKQRMFRLMGPVRLDQHSKKTSLSPSENVS